MYSLPQSRAGVLCTAVEDSQRRSARGLRDLGGLRHEYVLPASKDPQVKCPGQCLLFI